MTASSFAGYVFAVRRILRDYLDAFAANVQEAEEACWRAEEARAIGSRLKLL